MLLCGRALRRGAVRAHCTEGPPVWVGLVRSAVIAGWLSIVVAKITVRGRRLRREAHFWPRVHRVGVGVAVGLAGHGVRVGLRSLVRVVRRVGGPVTRVLSGRFATG